MRAWDQDGRPGAELGFIESADAFILQIVVSTFETEGMKLPSVLTTHYIPGLEPKDQKQIFASNLAFERGGVMQSALMENVKQSVPGAERIGYFLPYPASQNLCPTVLLDIALTKSDLEELRSEDFLPLTVEISQAVLDYRKRVGAQLKAPTPEPTGTRPAGKHPAGGRARQEIKLEAW